MDRGLTQEDLREELRTSISNVLRQEVTDFSINVRRDLREEFRKFFEEWRFWLEPQPTDSTAVMRPPSAGLCISPSARLSRNAASLRRASIDVHLPPSPPQEYEDESNAVLRRVAAPLISERLGHPDQTSAKRSSWRMFARRSSQELNTGGRKNAENEFFAKLPEAPKPACLSTNIQPPEQGPPMMFQSGQPPASIITSETGLKPLGTLPDSAQEIAEDETRQWKSADNMVKLKNWTVHPQFRESKDSSDARFGHACREPLSASGAIEEDRARGVNGIDESWQQAVTQAPGQIVEMSANGESEALRTSTNSMPMSSAFSRSMTVDRMDQMALARERAVTLRSDRSSFASSASHHSGDSSSFMDYGTQLTELRSSAIRASREDKRKTMMQRMRGLRSKIQPHIFLPPMPSMFQKSPTMTPEEMETGRRNTTGRRRAHHLVPDKGISSRNSGMTFMPRLGSMVSDKFDFGTDSSHWRFSKWVAYIVTSEYFDYCMGVLLVANAITIGVQVDHNAQNLSTEVPTIFRVIETLFCVVFTVELSMRVFVFRSLFFSTKGWQWNMFDSAVISFQIADEFTKMFAAKSKAREVIDGMGVLRMLRLGRIVRLIRMVRLIPELKSMVYLISASMWSFFWTVVLLVLVMYCFAVYYTEVATDIRDQDSLADSDREAIHVHWGSVSQSILSLYKAITGGDDWVNFVQVFDNALSNYTINTLVFCLYMAFAVMVMLNLVTGVFVEGAQRIIKEDKDGELIKQVRKLFRLADADGSQEITWEEFQAQMNTTAMDSYFKAVDLSRKEAKDLFKLLDVDQSGAISVEEFVRGCLRLRGPARSVDLAALVYDLNQKHITVKGHIGFLEKQLDMVTDQVTRTCTFLNLCATMPEDESIHPEAGTNGLHEVGFNEDAILV